MNRDDTYKLFEPFITKMKDGVKIKFFKYVFDKLPEYWFHKPASSGGKYHPKFANIEDGGLVKHTLYATYVFDYLWRAFSKEVSEKYPDVSYDDGIIAIVFHDAVKYGVPPLDLPHTTKTHDVDGKNWIWKIANEFTEKNKELINECTFLAEMNLVSLAIDHHMGPWSTNGVPQGLFEQLIFIADCVASQKTHEMEVFKDGI